MDDEGLGRRTAQSLGIGGHWKRDFLHFARSLSTNPSRLQCLSDKFPDTLPCVLQWSLLCHVTMCVGMAITMMLMAVAIRLP